MDKKEILDILDNAKDERGAVPMRLVRQAFDKLVQPEERTEKRTETRACVLISQQAAIDALDVLCQEHRYKIPGKRETYSQYNEAWQDALDRAEGAIFNLPPAQPEEAIPVSWIEARIKRFMTMDNAFGGLTANIMLVMLNEWKREQEGETT